jgi:hypothetical protein
MKRYFVSAMFAAGWDVGAENEEKAIDKFCEEAEYYIDGDIDENTFYVTEVEEDK